MLTIKRLRYKNFLSTGNVFTEWELDNAPTTLIFGRSGSGKSTFIDALCFGLFGRSFRKTNKPLLVNSANDKELIVEVELNTGGSNFLIRRGIKPSIFEIYKDDSAKPINQDAATIDYQILLEQNILKLNYRTFCQVVVLGSSNYTPFMQLKASERRFIVEDLLDISIFSKMNTALKERDSKNKELIQNTTTNIEIATTKKDLHNSFLESRKADIDGQINSNEKIINTNTDTIVKLNTEKQKLEKTKLDLEEINPKIKETENLIKNCKDKINEANSKVRALNKEIEYYTNTVQCATCHQDITAAFKDNIVEKNSKLITNYQNGIEKVKGRIEKHTLELVELNKTRDEYDKCTNSIIKIDNEIHNLKTFNNKIKRQIEELVNTKNEDTSKREEELNNLHLYIESLHESKITALDKRYQYEILSGMLKDSGVKTKIIAQYLPIMNKLVNKYLNAMELYTNFQLDPSFKETISSHGQEDFSYESFSEGEKTRINLALLFAWREIAKIKNSANVNLLIFDEIMDSSLDNEGIEAFIKIIEDISGDFTKVIIISHRNAENMQDKFKKVVTFEKVHNFSIMNQL